MKRIKRLVFVAILTFIAIIAPKVNAASVSIATNKDSMKVGETAIITVSINAAAWSINVPGLTSTAIENFNMAGTNTTTSQTYQFTPTEATTYTFTASGTLLDESRVVLITDANSVPDLQATYEASLANAEAATSNTITITVTANQTESNNSSNNNNTNNNANSNSTKTTGTNKADENNTSIDQKEELKQEESTAIKITKFEIEGYDLDFDSETLEYTLDIDEIATSLNINILGENIQVEGAGVVNIKDKDTITITITSGDKKVEYKINLRRLSSEALEKIQEENKDTNKTTSKVEKINAFSIIIPIIGVITIIGNAIVLIKIFKNKEF